MKICRGCKQSKELSEFTRDKMGKGGLKSRCRSCLTVEKRESRHRNPIPSRLAAARWRVKNREKVRGYGRAWRKANREAVKLNGKRWQQKNPERCKFLALRNVLKRYGLTPESYAGLLTEQGGGCAICQTPPKECRLSVDHCHRTGRVRGLLCKNCNTGIGLLKGRPLLLFKAADYLKRLRCEF